MIERNLKLEIEEEYSNFLSMQLNEAKELIKKLEFFKNNPYAFDDQTINRIIDVNQKLKLNIVNDLYHCRGFYKQNISEEEIQNVKKIEEQLKALQKCIEQLLFLMDPFKNKIFGKMLSVKDEEVALNFLMGKIYSPFQLGNLDLDDEDLEDDFDDDDEYDYEEEEDGEEGDEESEAFISALNDKFRHFIEKKPPQEIVMSFIVDHTVADERFMAMVNNHNEDQLFKYCEKYEGFNVLMTMFMELYDAVNNK